MCHCKQNYFYLRILLLCAVFGVGLTLPLINEHHSDNQLYNAITAPEPQYAYITTDMATGSAILHYNLNSKAPHQLFKRAAMPSSALDTPVDVDYDMELAEINVFRPLFRYRAAISRQVGQTQQFG